MLNPPNGLASAAEDEVGATLNPWKGPPNVELAVDAVPNPPNELASEDEAGATLNFWKGPPDVEIAGPNPPEANLCAEEGGSAAPEDIP